MISEDAARLGTMARDTTAVSALQSVQGHLQAAIDAMMMAENTVNADADVAAMLAGGENGAILQGEGQSAGSAISEAISQIVTPDMDTIINRVQEFYQSLLNYATMHGG
jgi:hypothetical protein